MLQYNKMVNQIIERFQDEKLLPRNIVDGEKVSNLKITKFYISSKIHRLNNSGIPEINSVDCHISQIPRFINHHLQPFVRQIPSNVKDKNHFINKASNFSRYAGKTIIHEYTIRRRYCCNQEKI